MDKRKAHHKQQQLKRDAINRESMGLKRAAGLKFISGRQAEADWRRMAALIPEDTRTLTGRLCGDPLPGRSALDDGVVRQ